MIDVNNIRIDFIKQVGDLSNKKIEKLQKDLKDKFSAIDKLQYGGYIFINELKNLFLIVTNNQVTLEIRGVNVTYDKSFLYDILKKVFDILLLDEETEVLLSIVGLIKSVSSTFNKSLKFIENHSIDNIDSIYGVGYKFFMKEGKYIGELKIEPLVRDDKYFYIQYIMSSNRREYPVREILDDVEILLNKLKEDIYKDIVSKIIE
ncbi:hypothetical protein [Caloranaerobacter azorensis]|uniref:Uncharacterized protein n=2 Tax=Caloranaerobacter azorensis TaxID=116090 RepID=A0A096BFL2_9FIRM|nr:hypothetical protein [Caloranaerobacter azorensis]KGG79637.1 hypothetical protein Y919_10910 [Caloranaerobacter azorensis H53214]QIB27572.1 hypothetical protein G3A45_09910 [Caloranaerobacter azorensis]